MGAITTVLDLDTIVPDRSIVKIRTAEVPEGVLCEIRHRHELSLEQLKQLEVLSAKCKDLLDADFEDITPEEAKVLDGWVHELLVMTFHSGFTQEIENALDYGQKMKILTAFKEVCLTEEGQTTMKTPRGKNQPKRKTSTSG